jgi:hypothetical protein
MYVGCRQFLGIVEVGTQFLYLKKLDSVGSFSFFNSPIDEGMGPERPELEI